MMMLEVSRRDFTKAYRKHYESYKATQNKGVADISRGLLLVYAVECGLKSYVMKMYSIEKWSELNINLRNTLESFEPHNIQQLMNIAKITSFDFPSFKTRYGDTVNANTYHQFCRYAPPLDDRDTKINSKVKEYDLILQKIARDLEGRLRIK